MELSLERYRHAALQTSKLPAAASAVSFQNSGGITGSNNPNTLSLPSGSLTENDKRLKPRLLLNMFPGSNILKNDKLHLQSTLNGWQVNSFKR